jgi:hypothetical protein
MPVYPHLILLQSCAEYRVDFKGIGITIGFIWIRIGPSDGIVNTVMNLRDSRYQLLEGDSASWR